MKTPADFRQRAEEYQSQMQEILASKEIDSDFTTQLAAITSACSARTYMALADVLETVEVMILAGRKGNGPNDGQSLLRPVLDRNAKLREAASRGDWEAVNKLINADVERLKGDGQEETDQAQEKAVQEAVDSAINSSLI